LDGKGTGFEKARFLHQKVHFLQRKVRFFATTPNTYLKMPATPSSKGIDDR
jgi:hypothetical protein